MLFPAKFLARTEETQN